MNSILFGDCRDSLRKLAAQGIRVQTCVTSPPYYGLRDYDHPGQIGLEETPEQFIQNLVEVFRCVRDVLAEDGTLWVNIGDSYAGRTTGARLSNAAQLHGTRAQGKNVHQRTMQRNGVPEGMKHKDMMGIPWALAFALRADGWYLRQDIIWHKPNPMPEAITDRCTKAHEYIFLLSKAQKYFYDIDAIKEPVSGTAHSRGRGLHPKTEINNANSKANTSFSSAVRNLVEKRNKRSVWSVAPRAYKGAHFATFPAELILPCVLAGSRKGDVVLDPFMGSGTTAEVSILNGRQYIGCELNQDYEPLIQKRIDDACVRVRGTTSELF